MDIKNLLSNIISTTKPIQKEQMQNFTNLYPNDFSTNETNFQNENQNQGFFSLFNGDNLSTILPLLISLLSGKGANSDIISKISSISPSLKNLEPIVNLFSKNKKQENEQEVSTPIDSYKRIE